MRKPVCAALLITLAVMSYAQTTVKEKLAPDTPKSTIIGMDPARVDPSNLPLDRVDQLHPTGIPQKIEDMSAWRLAVEGKGLARTLSFGYADLLSLPAVKKKSSSFARGSLQTMWNGKVRLFPCFLKKQG